ncbi:xanthine dehydrogenase family protein molybdopterin-binding subunit [Acuticoccus mangrovi]|uniref:Xanthine dehydrogenase family protein n=1 Tax=Acuticoccus mangrovi TaxID=2796142 RepID=A0A934MCA8_9HYPH|nr:xanthine dehydrogenase family protein molybdopterin-binding subunit [Acuticoccus mangrovi]MBJ3775077.1 xanthine dehydrogenase family protein [Acuticoccus mangrovi]
MKHVGRSHPRLGDTPFLTGKAGFVGDIALVDQLHMRVVRSPIAFGRLRGIDAAAAFAVPGLVAVWTAEDVAALPPVGFRLAAAPTLEPYCQPVLAVDVVRYVGEPVAVVFATTATAAEDAAELVALDIDLLAPVLTLTGSSRGFEGETRPAEAATVRKAFGDLAGAMARADRVVEVSVGLDRDGAVPGETRGVVARWDGGRDVIEIWGDARLAPANRDALATMLGRPLAGVEINAVAVGGDFGMRGELYPEDVLVAYAARTLERPVRWIEDRREHLIAADQARAMAATAKAAVAADGRLLALDVEFAIDQGAYLRPTGTMVADLTAAMLPGPYRLEAFRAVGRVRMTNRTPAGAYRGAGRVEATFVRERLMDAVAAATGSPPLEVRRRSFLTPEEMPADRHMTTLGVPMTIDSGRYQSLIDQLTKRFSLELVHRRAIDRRAHGELAGVGTAVFVETSAAGKYEHVTLSVDPSGNLELVTTASELGQGLSTLLAQIVADIVGADPERIRVTHGASTRLGDGVGTFLARSSVMAGTAAQYAAELMRDKILAGAEALLEVPRERLTIHSGRIREADRHFGTALELADLARKMLPGGPLAGADGRGLVTEGWVEGEGMTFPYGVAVAVAEIDAMTGLVRVPRVFIGYDVGNAINPALVESQIATGAVQGLSSALFTSLDVSPAGEPLRVGLTDYLIPSATESPSVDVLITEDAPSLTNPLGMKGAGTAGVTGIGAAVAAAIDEALQVPGFTTHLPVRPVAIRNLLRKRSGKSERG